MTVRAGIYQRISDDRRGDELGVTRQEEDNRALCEQRGWEVADVFTDNDISASRGRRRPEYERMLQAVKDGELDALVAWHPDRLHRQPRELESFIDLLEASGVRVATVRAGEYDLTTAAGRMTARVVGAVARHEGEQKAERLRRKAQQKAEMGEPSGGGSRPFGYDSAMRRRVRPREARVIKTAVEMLLSGASQAEIVRYANTCSKTTAGKPWTLTRMRRVLNSAAIAGIRESGGVVVNKKAAWKPIISVEEHERVRAILSNVRRHRSPTRYLLTGPDPLVFCGLCGVALAAQPKADGRACYRCPQPTNAVASQVGCGRIRHLAGSLEHFVVEVALRFALHPDVVAWRRAEWAAARGEAQKMREELGQLQLREERLTDLAVDGLLSKAELRRKAEDLRRQRRDVERRLGRVQSAEEVLVTAGGYEACRQRWGELTFNQQREALRSLVQRVVVKPAVRGRNSFDPRRVDVQLDWGAHETPQALEAFRNFRASWYGP